MNVFANKMVETLSQNIKWPKYNCTIELKYIDNKLCYILGNKENQDLHITIYYMSWNQ